MLLDGAVDQSIEEDSVRGGNFGDFKALEAALIKSVYAL